MPTSRIFISTVRTITRHRRNFQQSIPNTTMLKPLLTALAILAISATKTVASEYHGYVYQLDDRGNQRSDGLAGLDDNDTLTLFFSRMCPTGSRKPDTSGTLTIQMYPQSHQWEILNDEEFVCSGEQVPAADLPGVQDYTVEDLGDKVEFRLSYQGHPMFDLFVFKDKEVSKD
jgi:hypothetical protein